MIRFSALLALVALAIPAAAQYPFSNVSLYSQINLTTFGSSSGNGCWGYVTPAGKEFALMGLSNKVAFVNITNPAAPIWVTSVAHPSSSWADIKVYGRYCYVVTEAGGSGIQVIDMAGLDSVPPSVTLVRTIPAPGRSHTIHVDETSGFLYTCGSRENSGWQTCWSLANPSNPVRVGPASMTGGDYMHECQVKTYTSGPLAGKQIFYGCSESRGLDIYDVTDKNNPILLRRITYPGVAYCHQGWLSEDLKYFYVDDELDEINHGSVQKTFIFDVSDPANAFLAGTFTRNESNIDHNQYVHDGFIFQANYTRGLRIYDQSDIPTAPAFVGFFDTFPSNNSANFNGAWSNYPFFPSGTVIISDIDRGLFIVNPTQAVRRLNVNGTVNLEDWMPGPDGQVVTIEVRRPALATIYKTVTLNAAGYFAFTLNNTLTSANCSIVIRGSHWLGKSSGTVNLGETGITGLNLSLKNGDIDGDNGIDVGDYSILSAFFGSASPIADIDGDGDVSIGDFAILSANFGLNGA